MVGETGLISRKKAESAPRDRPGRSQKAIA